MENGLHIKFRPHIPIEKPISKTHALVFGIKMLEEIHSSRIHTNPKQITSKTET